MQWTIGWWMRNKPEITLYHYTTVMGLLGIIETQTVWATGVRFLNDASELSYAAKAITELLSIELETRTDAISRLVLMELRNRLGRIRSAGVYVVSFCEGGDLLSQWRAYGHGAGYSIGFGTEYWDYQHNGSVRLRKVLYGAEEQEGLIKELLRLTYEEITQYMEKYEESVLIEHYVRRLVGYLGTVLAEVMPCLKHPAFEEEREWRLIVRQGNEYVKGRDPTHEVHFRDGVLGLVPFIKLPLPGRKDPFIGRLPITEVYHGPSEHPDEVQEALSLLLRKHSYGEHGTAVKGATAPLRV